MIRDIWLKQRCTLLAVLLFTLLSPCGSAANHTIYLVTSNTIPSYCQEDEEWCGPAAAQMVLEGYPAAEHRFSQADLWGKIQTHNADTRPWLTDPEGMRGTLMELGADVGVNWEILSNMESSSLMYSIAYWMTKRRFPVAVLADATGASIYGSIVHWLVIVGITTDANPVDQTSTQLISVDVYNPAGTPCESNNDGGVESTVLAATWYDYYWRSAGNYSGSKWHGQYVAVVEPPPKSGVAQRPKVLAKSGTIVSKDQAMNYAAQWLKQYGFENKYAVLKGSVPLTASLVVNLVDKRIYYLVPLVYKGEKVSRGAVLVNPYDGRLEELGAFKNALQYMSKESATEIALKHCPACGSTRDARLVIDPRLGSRNRYIPLWEIVLQKKIFYVTQHGRIFERIGTYKPRPPGD